LRPHQTNRQQIADLLAIVERDLEDASTVRLSTDWQFAIAYNASLKLCTILLYAEGYRPERNLAHYRTLQALAKILGNDRQSDADYLDTCRSKRNLFEYDMAGRTSAEEAKELLEFSKELHGDVMVWLEKRHPSYLPHG